MKTLTHIGFINVPLGFPLFILTMLLGRFPLWLLFLLVYTGAPHMNIKAFFAFACTIILAKGILFAYENKRSIAFGSFMSLWQHIFKPFLTVIIVYTGLIGLMLAFPNGAKSAQIMALMAFLLLIGIFILHFREVEKPAAVRRTVLERDAALHLTLVLMWLYVFFFPDGSIVAAIMVLGIYILEFASTWQVRDS